MNDLTDQQLLHDYAERRSDAAFDELVRRHIDAVYSAALRLTGEEQSARDATQAVFVVLAQKAASLTGHPVLSGWLHTTARNQACKSIRSEIRRRVCEQEAATMNQLLSADPDATWEHIAPHLDGALGELHETERDALMLRYFEKKSAPEMAGLLGISEEAAQKRVSRAVEHLRELFSKRKVTIGTSGLVILISANAVQAAPIGLATAIATVSVAGTAVTTSAVIAATKTIAMTTLQKVLVTATVAVLAGTGLYETHQAAQLRDQNLALQQSQATLADQLRQLQSERDAAANRLASSAENVATTRNNNTELLRLRGEVTRLRIQADQADDPIVKKALLWKANVEKMKQLFAEHPEQRVPEMKLLSEEYFFDLARGQDLESSNGIRQAFSEIRQRAKNTFAVPLQAALKKFIDENSGQLPGSVSDLKPYFTDPVDDAMLDQYKMLFTGKMSDVKGNFVLRDKQVVDPEFDNAWQIGPYAFGPDASGHENALIKAQAEILQPAVDSFIKSNGGGAPLDLSQLKPFITTPEQQAAYDELVKAGVSPARQ